MPFKHKIAKSTATILLVGLLAFLICQPHPAIGDEHGPAAGTDESCQVLTIPSAVLSGPLLAAPSQIPGHADSLFISTSALDFEGVFSYCVSGNAGLLILPLSTIKRYQLICTYRL